MSGVDDDRSLDVTEMARHWNLQVSENYGLIFIPLRY